MGGLWEEIRTLLHGIWQRRWIALAIAWALCLAGWLVVSQMPNTYESRARVQVQLRQILPGDSIATQQEQQKDVDRIRQTLTSAVNLEKVVRGTELANTVANDKDVAARVAGLQQKIKVVAQQDNLFEITATASNGKLARSIVQKLIDIFVEDNLTQGRDQASQSLTFLDQQLADRQKALQAAEAKKAEFQARYLGSLPGTGTLTERLATARSQLAGTFPTSKRLEKASGMTVIGSVGEVVTAAQTALRKKRLQMFAAATGGLVFAWVALLGLEMFQRGVAA